MSTSGPGAPAKIPATTAGFVALAVGLAALVLASLLVLQPAFGLRSVLVFGPLALVGIALTAGLSRWAEAGTALEDMTLRAPAQAPIASSSEQGSPQPDPYDDVDYLAALRHEFRTPLNAVLGFSDVLLNGIDGQVNDSQREDLEIIRASGMKLQVLLDSALDLSELVNETLKPDSDSVDATQVVERAAREAGQLWAGKREVRMVSPTDALEVLADATRLRRCILVLADILATDFRHAVIELAMDSTNDHLVVSISANPSTRLSLDALPTPAEVIGAEDPMKIRRWPVAVSSEVIAMQGGSLYHGDDPARFVIRLPLGRPA